MIKAYLLYQDICTRQIEADCSDVGEDEYTGAVSSGFPEFLDASLTTFCGHETVNFQRFDAVEMKDLSKMNVLNI